MHWAILDTNVARVLSRVFLPAANPKQGAHRTALWALSERLIPRGKGYDFNQALMDFGATVCVARKPACPTCTMRTICKTFRRTIRRHANGRRPRTR